MTELQVFESIENNRKAILFQDGDCYVVEMYEDGSFRGEREIVMHNQLYAEDCAENWIMKVIK